jgi:glycosyltransferase involved in cell wall biosynthesis
MSSVRLASGRSRRPTVLVVGPVPPPFHGGAVVTRMLLESPLRERFDFLHLDTTDRRGVDNIGRLDVGNVRLAAAHGARFVGMLLRHHVDFVYSPIAGNTLGLLRDALFVGPTALRRIPFVLHFHGGRYDSFVASAAAPVRALVRSLLARAQCAIVVGAALRPMLDGLVPHDRVVVVPNGVADLTGGQRLDTGDVRTRILFLGNLFPAKGYTALLTAAQRLLQEGEDIDVTFAGGVFDPPTHRRAMAAVQYPDRIRFLGPVGVDQKRALLRSSHVLALPSENEAHPLVILEAMAAGMAVVSTRCAAIPETVLHEETGLLVEPGEVDQLTAALRTLTRDATLRARFGRAGRERYVSMYTVEQWVRRMSGVFERVAAEVA